MDELNLDNILEGEKAVMPKISAYKMVALRGVVVFPTQTLHFDVGRDKSMLALERAKADNENIFLVAQKEASGVQSFGKGHLPRGRNRAHSADYKTSQ